MNTQHTPGPWGIINGDGGPIIFSGSNGQAVAQAVRAFSTSERDANAHLIATAPDLLEALKQSLEALEYYADLTEEPSTASGASLIARAAIAKATGETH